MNYRKMVEDKIGRKLSRNEVVHHVDGNCRNNKWDNLEVKSLSDHSRDHMKGRPIPILTRLKLQIQSRRARPGAKLSKKQVRQIRQLLLRGQTQLVIAKKFGVRRQTVSAIWVGDIWAWLK